MSTLYYYNTNTNEWTPVVMGKQGPQGLQGETGPAGTIQAGDTAPSSPQVNDLWVDTSGSSATLLDLDNIVQKIIDRGIIQSIASQSSVSFETFMQAGNLFAGTGARRFTFPIRGFIQGWIATVNEPPIGSSLVVRLMLNDIMLDEGEISHGSTIMFERPIALANVNPGDRISINIVSTGSSEPGRDLVVTVRWQPKIDNQWFTADGESIDVLDTEGIIDQIVDALAAYQIVTSSDINQIVKITESEFAALQNPDPTIWYIVKEDPN